MLGEGSVLGPIAGQGSRTVNYSGLNLMRRMLLPDAKASPFMWDRIRLGLPFAWVSWKKGACSPRHNPASLPVEKHGAFQPLRVLVARKF